MLFLSVLIVLVLWFTGWFVYQVMRLLLWSLTRLIIASRVLYGMLSSMGRRTDRSRWSPIRLIRRIFHEWFMVRYHQAKVHQLLAEQAMTRDLETIQALPFEDVSDVLTKRRQVIAVQEEVANMWWSLAEATKES